MTPKITLNKGVRIPQLGFGVFQIGPEETVEVTLSALEIGYRHIDTAEAYGNGKDVGRAVRESGIPREEHIQRGDIVFRKSVVPERVKENFALFDFELSNQEVAAITGLNRDERTGWDPDKVRYVP